MANIKNLIFDFGGVLLDLDERATYEAFMRLGLHAVPGDLGAANQAFQRGKITERQFLDSLKKHMPSGVMDSQIKDAWCAMLRDVPGERLGLLEKLGKKYRLFLLSNTDDIHINCLAQRDEAALVRFESLFEKVYYSQRTGYRKPEPEIFEMVLRENGLVPSQTLFVDDIRENAEAAGKVGMPYFWLDLSKYSFKDIPDILARYREE